MIMPGVGLMEKNQQLQPPSGDLVFCNSILLAWIRRLIAMRHKRGERFRGLSEGVQVMPSSSEIGKKITS